MLATVMLPADCANRLMLRTDKAAINMAGNDMGRAVAPPTVATGDEMTGGAVDAAAGGALTGTGWAERLMIDTTERGIALAGGSAAGRAVG